MSLFGLLMGVRVTQRQFSHREAYLNMDGCLESCSLDSYRTHTLCSQVRISPAVVSYVTLGRDIENPVTFMSFMSLIILLAP